MPASAPISPLPPDRLYRQADIAALHFETTRELAPLDEFADQPRAHEAIRFGTDMAVRGFNIFAIGANRRAHPGVGACPAGRRRCQAAEAVRLGVCQQLRHAASAGGDRAAAGPRAGAGQGAGRTDRRPEGRAAGGVRERGLPEAPRRHRTGDPRPQRARLHRVARQGDGKGHRDPAHADGLRHGADEGRPGGAACRVQRLAGGAPARGADGDRGAGKGPGRDAARGCRGWSANSATRCARWIAKPPACVIAQPIEECKAQFADLPKVVQHLDAIQADILENVALFVAPQAPGEDAAPRGPAACSTATR